MRYILPEPESENVIVEEIDLKLNMAEKELTTEELFIKYFPKEDYNKTVIALARMIHGEAIGVKSITNRAALIWEVGNRVDRHQRGDTFLECVKSRHQFCFRRKYTEEEIWIVEDVLNRWLREKMGEVNVGRILPTGFCFHHGNGEINIFRDKYLFKDNPKLLKLVHSEIYGD